MVPDFNTSEGMLGVVEVELREGLGVAIKSSLGNSLSLTNTVMTNREMVAGESATAVGEDRRTVG